MTFPAKQRKANGQTGQADGRLEVHRAVVPVELSSRIRQILHVALIVVVRFAVRIVVRRARTVVVVQEVRIVAEHLVHFLSDGRGGERRELVPTWLSAESCALITGNRFGKLPIIVKQAKSF